VNIGHQESVTVLAAGSRQWAILQQPQHATNTVSLSFGATTTASVAGQGFELTQATATSPVPQLVVGFGTNLPTSDAITAITDSGSTTLKVISCK